MGHEAWDWMVFSNPITEMILDDVGVSEDDRARMRQELDRLVGDRRTPTTSPCSPQR